ncbi:MAG: hypothetical protein JXP34_07345 [Planctomycetes bacterium]|nr:hypothetical protein [Planctomycetota bacterium]
MKGMSPIVQTVTRWIRAFIVLFGIYVICYGHISPGGGFAGGVVIACGFILLMLALGREACERKYSIRWAERLDAAGALMFATLALAGFGAGFFFRNFLGDGRPFELASAGSIPLGNIAIGLKVSASLFLVVAVLSVLRISPARPTAAAGPAKAPAEPAKPAHAEGSEEAAAPEGTPPQVREPGVAPPHRAAAAGEGLLPRAWALRRKLPGRRRGLGGTR